MTVLLGDCLDSMAAMPSDSVDSIVSDPPYGLAFMGKAWDHGVPGEPFWAEALRVAKPGAYLVAFGGTRTYHRLACAIEDAGWEIRDCLSYLYGSGFPKSHNGPWGGTALKPAWEPIILARKPLMGTVAANVAAHGTGGLNIDGCRIPSADVIPPMSGKAILAGTSEGWDRPWKNDAEGIARRQVAANIAIEKANTLGRWPANVCLDEDAAGMLDEQTGTLTSGANPTRRGSAKFSTAYGEFEGREECTPARGVDAGGASRFFFVAREGQCDSASNAEPSSTQSSGLDGSAPSGAVTSANREAVPQGPSQRGQDCTADCTDCTPRQSLASSAEEPDSIGTTPTTPTCCESCGSALPATADFTSPASVARVADASDPVSGTRFLYSAKASRREREAGLEGMPKGQPVGGADKWTETDRRRGEGVTREPAANVHPTVKPIALMRWLCRLVTPPGGLILDPFTGSGTTGCAAVLEGFRFLGCEKEVEYVAIAEKRIAYWANQKDAQGTLL